MDCQYDAVNKGNPGSHEPACVSHSIARKTAPKLASVAVGFSACLAGLKFSNLRVPVPQQFGSAVSKLALPHHMRCKSELSSVACAICLCEKAL